MQTSIIFVILAVAASVYCYPKFKDNIPNGHVVPNPCYDIVKTQQDIWGGVGHKNISGGGDLNPFGDVSFTLFLNLQ